MGPGCLAAAVLATVCGPLSAQVRFEVRAESGVAGEAIAAGLNQVVKPSVFIVNSAPGTFVQGFQMAVTHDPALLDFQSATWKGTALDSASLRNSLGPYFFSAREVAGSPAGFTLGVVFEDQAANFVLGQGESHAAALAYKALKATTEGSPARIDFAQELGTPPIANRYDDRTTGASAAAETRGLAVTVGAEQAYMVAFRDSRVTADAGTEVTIPIVIQNSPREVDGFSFGIKHDAAKLELLDVTLAAGVTGVVPSPDDRFLSIQKTPAGGSGFTVAMILSATDKTKFLDPQKSPHHVLDARYRLKLQAGTTDLQVTGELGLPKVEVILDLAGAAQRPLPPATNPPPTTLTIESRGGTFDQRFIRGDLDQNGRINITDTIGILRYLFDRDAMPEVFKPTAAECLIAFNVNGDADGTGIEDPTRIDVSDAIFLLNYTFLKGLVPPAPFGGGRACALFTGQATDPMKCIQFRCP
jgi:hypothetical protein